MAQSQSEGVRTTVQAYDRLRHLHPAWRLLSARRAPLVAGCLKLLFAQRSERVRMTDAVELLAQMLAEHANQPDYGIDTTDYGRLARRELRQQIKAKLLVERDGELIATDALQQALRFLDRLEERIMSSTASRLATVQQQISDVSNRLNPEPEVRAARIRENIAELEAELERVERGEVEVLEGPDATEAIQEVFSLAMSLHDDFGQVEDSYRRADQELRVSIFRDQNHRGAVMDQLLEGHEALLETNEGRLFQAFFHQLSNSDELEKMNANLVEILNAPPARDALNRRQQMELRQLHRRLVAESNKVIRARGRAERDVRNYLRIGLGAEHTRVTRLLDDILEHALDLPWESQPFRRSDSPLPPIAPAVAVPAPERIRLKDITEAEADDLDFRNQSVDLEEVDGEFWRALDGLDRRELARRTVEVVTDAGRSMTMAEVAAALPPSHDLETLSVWVEMCHQAGCHIGTTGYPATADGREDADGRVGNDRREDHEVIDVETGDGTVVRFHTPVVVFEPDALAGRTWEL